MIYTSVDPGVGLVTHTGLGELSFEEVAEALTERVRDPRFRPGMVVLWDCRDASLTELTSDQMQRMISFHKEHEEERGAGSTAIVVLRDSDYGMARMLRAHAEGIPWDTLIFRDMDRALDWLIGGGRGVNADEQIGANIIRFRANGGWGSILLHPDISINR